MTRLVIKNTFKTMIGNYYLNGVTQDAQALAAVLFYRVDVVASTCRAPRSLSKTKTTITNHIYLLFTARKPFLNNTIFHDLSLRPRLCKYKCTTNECVLRTNGSYGCNCITIDEINASFFAYSIVNGAFSHSQLTETIVKTEITRKKTIRQRISVYKTACGIVYRQKLCHDYAITKTRRTLKFSVIV